MTLAINRGYAEYNEPKKHDLPKPKIFGTNYICNGMPMDRERIEKGDYCDSKCFREHICKRICEMLLDGKKDEAMAYFNSYIK